MIYWLTGNSGAGKTTLAYGVKDKLKAIVLDGDEMRATISKDEGLSPEDRHKHNMRVARLANLLSMQGFPVIIAVIAPFTATRAEIDKICKPRWIYIKRSGLGAEDRPYEEPLNASLTINNDKLSIAEAQNIFYNAVAEWSSRSSSRS